MDRRYQVFISSTFSDLKEERAEIIQALLELDCIPAGMELFPATTEEAWELIKGVIDDSDYYCLVIGGRYGSVDSTGLGYTEKEYDYAVAQKKPVVAFIHAEPDSLPASKSEKTEQGRLKLANFIGKVEAAHHRRSWKTAAELGGLVSRALINVRKSSPAEGWVRGRFAASEAMLLELANLRARIAELEAEAVKESSTLNQALLENLASGGDVHVMRVSVRQDGKQEHEEADVDVTWDEILRYVGPSLLGECTEDDFFSKLQLCAYHKLQKKTGMKVSSASSVVIPYVVRDRIKVQLQALGQVAPGIKRRAVADQKTYWRLTDVGANRLITAQAIRKKVTPSPKAALAPSATK